ncbi:unnamed protein product [Rotaria socialis]|uniref:Uncharacterized protein n=1 Tax=Rotaria socialis TaxID=392032 RepID=A0A818N205_9BILA|nr:unnamed protein product [Rotaria socialis]
MTKHCNTQSFPTFVRLYSYSTHFCAFTMPIYTFFEYSFIYEYRPLNRLEIKLFRTLRTEVFNQNPIIISEHGRKALHDEEEREESKKGKHGRKALHDEEEREESKKGKHGRKALHDEEEREESRKGKHDLKALDDDEKHEELEKASEHGDEKREESKGRKHGGDAADEKLRGALSHASQTAGISGTTMKVAKAESDGKQTAGPEVGESTKSQHA